MISYTGMMEPMQPSLPPPGPQMMMGHPGHQGAPMPGHPSMMAQPQSPFTAQGPMDFPQPPHGAHPSFAGEFPPGAPPHPGHMSRQMSHPGHHGMPPQPMMMSPQGAPYMNGPGPGPGPYMMGGLQ